MPAELDYVERVCSHGRRSRRVVGQQVGPFVLKCLGLLGYVLFIAYRLVVWCAEFSAYGILGPAAGPDLSANLYGDRKSVV